MSPLSRLTVAGSGDAVQSALRVTLTFIAFLLLSCQLRWERSDLTLSCVGSPQLSHPFVNPHILFRRRIPGEVPGHAVAHQGLPRSVIAVRLQRLFDGQQQ